MKVAVLSGKGGTGKTFVAVNLAYTDKNSVYIDCDVEEPNGHLFFKPEIMQKADVNVKIPVLMNTYVMVAENVFYFANFML
jgi:MinD superfamily P-loop ATPase